MKKLFLKIILCLIIIFFSQKFYYFLSDGFRIDKIYMNPKFEAGQASRFGEMDRVFNQPYKYLSKGCQTYVFESNDGNFVIKFVRYHRYQIPLWLKVVDIKNYATKRAFYKDKLLKDSLNSYQIASNFLKDETAIIYVHLNKTNFINKKLTIKDRFHRKYKLNLDDFGFIVQRKVDTFQKVLKRSQHNEEKLKVLTSSFLHTTRDIYLKGFINDDYNCIKNSGYIDNKVIHADLGSFLKREKIDEKVVFEKEFLRYVRYFKKWAKKNAPYLITYIDEEINKMSKEL